MKLTDSKLKRRMLLLDDLLDYALSSGCMFMPCDKPEAPIRHMKTCVRCACIHRAIKIGLVTKVKETFVKKFDNGGRGYVDAGSLEQHPSYLTLFPKTTKEVG